MKKIRALLSCCLLFIMVSISQAPYSSAGPDDELTQHRPYMQDLPMEGTWNMDKASISGYLNNAKNCTVPAINQINFPTYAVHVNPLPAEPKRLSYGGALNLRYFSGLSYEYLRKRLAGKTISLDVYIPKESVGSNEAIPNRLSLSVKSMTNNEWAEYHGDSMFTSVTRDGHYKLRLKIPDKPVETKDRGLFNPEDMLLVMVEYHLMEGSRGRPSISFSFSDFKIEDIDLHPEDFRWQFVENDSASKDVYIPAFQKGSTFMRALGMGANFEYTKEFMTNGLDYKFSGNLKDKFLVLTALVPMELCFQPGTMALTLTDDKNTVYSTLNDFHSCNLSGQVFLTAPLDSFSVENNIEELNKKLKIKLSINTQKLHTPDMMPIIIEPMIIRTGRLIPFDNKWKLRDMTNMSGSRDVTVREDEVITSGPLTAKRLAGGQYQLNAAMRLRGGIDWKNSFYRIELTRDFENQPVDLDNQHIEVWIDPLTVTTDFWQKPYRARVGVMDINDNVMFGPNISLSEGLPNIAYLDVSTTNPIPKGFSMPRFDPKNIRAVLINFEASHAALDPVDIKVSLVDLMVSPREYERINPFVPIDFSRFKADPSSWQLTKIIRDAGGYVVGINYPFPNIKVPREVMEVPQIYPGIGLKINDFSHYGFSSDITKRTMINDFKYFVSKNINIVRIFVLGYLDGVFMWDEKGKDITEFGAGREKLIRKLSEMDVKTFADYLNKNEETVFLKHSGILYGLEKYTMKDFTAILDILEQVEKETGSRLTAMISLYDFLVADGTWREGPLRKYLAGEHSEVITDPLVKVKVEALVWEMMKTLSRDKRFYKYITMVEVMNEPENASAVVTRKNFVDLVNFVGENLYLVKDAIGPSVPVTIGFRSWPPDLKYWSKLEKGIDALAPHYWQSLESYNIDTPGLWPLETHVVDLWKYLGAPSEGRPAGIAEISPQGDMKSGLFRVEKAGYDFTLLWSYSGHDGHDAKPMMDKIAEYQEGNYKFAALQKYSRGALEKAFILLLDAAKLKNKIAAGSESDVRKAIEDILEVMRLKDIALNEKNITFLRDRALSDKK